jgi:hypothetical protein
MGAGAGARSPRLGFLPALLVGASAAIAAEVAVAILLYGGVGLVRSLTTILAVEAAAFAGGVWSAPRGDHDLIERLRRRWLLCLVAFLAAAVFGTLWSIEVLGEGRWAQGAGLAVLAALPLYSAGNVLGGLAVAARTDLGRRLTGPGTAAAVGAAFGFMLTGYLLPRAPMPASLLVACLVMLSLGGMIFGTVLASRTEVEEIARRPARSGSVSVLSRRRPADEVAALELREDSHVRRVMPFERTPMLPWDVIVVRQLLPDLNVPVRVVFIGGGASSAPQAIVREHPLARVDTLERTGAVVELGRDHFGTGLAIARGDRLSVLAGNLDDLIESLEPGFDVVVFDRAAVAPIGGVGGLSRESVARLKAGLNPGGLFVWGARRPEPGAPEIPDGWAHAQYERPDTGDAETQVVLFCRASDGGWPEAFDEFRQVSTRGSDG